MWSVAKVAGSAAARRHCEEREDIIHGERGGVIHIRVRITGEPAGDEVEDVLDVGDAVEVVVADAVHDGSDALIRVGQVVPRGAAVQGGIEVGAAVREMLMHRIAGRLPKSWLGDAEAGVGGIAIEDARTRIAHHEEAAVRGLDVLDALHGGEAGAPRQEPDA